jgi:hypothetical protein
VLQGSKDGTQCLELRRNKQTNNKAVPFGNKSKLAGEIDDREWNQTRHHYESLFQIANLIEEFLFSSGGQI